MEIDLVQIIGIVRGHKPTPLAQRQSFSFIWIMRSSICGLFQSIVNFSPCRAAIPLTANRIRIGINCRFVVNFLRIIPIFFPVFFFYFWLFAFTNVDIYRTSHILNLNYHISRIEWNIDQKVLALTWLKINVNTLRAKQS